MRRYSLLVCILLLMGLPLSAQDDSPFIADISYGQRVNNTISDQAFFDWWHIQAQSGDVIYVEMQASDGLVPLIGLIEDGGNLLARSDTEFGTAFANDRAILEYDVETDGRYTIVATRDGNAEGTSTGSYELFVDNISIVPDRDNPYAEAEFRCGEDLVTTALILQFQDDIFLSEDTPEGTMTEFYRLTVYGEGDFQPVIRVEASVQEGVLDCGGSAEVVAGNTYTLPNEDTVTIPEDDTENVAQIIVNAFAPSPTFGQLTFTIASLDGGSGRFVIVLEGLALQDREDVDDLLIRLGPLANEQDLQVYMVGNSDTRLDPVMEWVDHDGELMQTCDDAGRGECPIESSIAGISAEMNAGDIQNIILADRFDAGLILNPFNSDIQTVRLQSRGMRTEGGYSLIFVGELP